MVEIEVLKYVVTALRARHQVATRDERGSIVADLILWGGIAAAAITVVVILTAKLTAKANSIPTD